MKKQEQGEIVIEKMAVGRVAFWVKGLTPFIFNAMSEKVKRELLLPRGKKTAADKAQNLKHNPTQEYRDSVYRRPGSGPTRLIFPATAFKRAMSCAALEIPGAKKAQINRLIWVDGETVDMYGVPKLLISVVRSADMNRTPDIRTRAILAEWCCQLTLKFVKPTMTETAVARLLETAGLVIAVGDFRQEKGAGNYGQFSICEESDVADIIKTGGIKVQDSALETPEAYDIESRELLKWSEEERVRRGK